MESEMLSESSGASLLDCNGTESSLEECFYQEKLSCGETPQVGIICNILKKG